MRRRLRFELVEPRLLLTAFDLNDFVNGGEFGTAFGEVNTAQVPATFEPGSRTHTFSATLRAGDVFGFGEDYINTGSHTTGRPDIAKLRNVATGNIIMESTGSFPGYLPEGGVLQSLGDLFSTLKLSYVIPNDGDYEIELIDTNGTIQTANIEAEFAVFRPGLEQNHAIGTTPTLFLDFGCQ